MSFEKRSWSGPLLVLGGAFWIASITVHALQPMGCVGDECSLPNRSMREGTPLGSALLIVGVLALCIGAWGLMRRAHGMGGVTSLASVGLITSFSGFALLGIAGLTQAIFYSNDFWGMPYIVAPAIIISVLGMMLLGLALLRSPIVPRWAAALLIISTLALLAMNEQNTYVLFAVPFGVAWMILGFVLSPARSRQQIAIDS